MARVRVKSSSSFSPSPQRMARCKRGQILAEALQHLEHRLAVVEEDVAPHHRIGGRDAGEVAEAAGGEFDHLGFQRLLEIGRGADDGVGDEMRQMRGDRQHLVVMLGVHGHDLHPRPLPEPRHPVDRRAIGVRRAASGCTSGPGTSRRSPPRARNARCRRRDGRARDGRPPAAPASGRG